MRNLVKVTLTFLTVIALGALTASIYYYSIVVAEAGGNQDNIENPTIVITLIMSAGDSEYTKSIKAGVMEAAAENNAAIVFHEIDDLSGDLGFSDYIDIARLAGHDAVITSGEFSNEFIEAVDKIVGEGVPVVISGFEDVQSSRDVFIGTNQYEFGTIAASLAADATYLEGYTNLAVINTKIYSNEEDQIDRRIAGLTGKILTNQDMRLITINNSSSDIIGAEDVTQDILRDFPSVNVIFCMNARDTIAAAQAVVDRNKVGDVKIIGTDVTPEILDFIDKGIIYGVIDRNGEEIGRQALESILNITDEELQSSYINVNMDVVTIENADDYRE